MRVLVFRIPRSPLPCCLDQWTRHGYSLCGRGVCLLDGAYDQAADGNARALRPVPQLVMQRFWNIDSGAD